MGLEYHQHLREHLTEMIKMKTISQEEAELILFTDNPDEVVAHVEKHSKHIIHHHKTRKPNWLLGEKTIKTQKK